MIERIYRIGGNRGRLLEVLSLLGNLLIKPDDDYQLIIGPARKEKSHAQRKLFHKLCTEAGKELGYTMGQVKAMVKEEHFGTETITARTGKTYEVVQSSEDADRMDYAALIDTLLRWAAENGVPLDVRSAA